MEQWALLMSLMFLSPQDVSAQYPLSERWHTQSQTYTADTGWDVGAELGVSIPIDEKVDLDVALDWQPGWSGNLGGAHVELDSRAAVRVGVRLRLGK